MFTKTQAHKIKNCDKKMATKKKRERNVERLKNNTKRSKNEKKRKYEAKQHLRCSSSGTKRKQKRIHATDAKFTQAKQRRSWSRVQQERRRGAGKVQQPPPSRRKPNRC